MKLTQVLCKHNISRTIRQMWYQRRQRKVISTETERLLRSNVYIQDASDVAMMDERDMIEFATSYEEEESNPPTCKILRDSTVLQEGLPQVQIITNTISLSDLPSSIEGSLVDLPEHVDDIVKRAISTSTIFDAHQEKLPIKKDPLRPAWVFPRDYGISNDRKMRNLSRKFLQICESISGPSIAEKRFILFEEPMQITFEKQEELIQFKVMSDVVVLSASPLKPMDDSDSNKEIHLPSLYPLHHCIDFNFQIEMFRETEDVYPIRKGIASPWENVHTIFVYHNPQKVRNQTRRPVTETQIVGRSLVKSYIAAATCARYRFGKIKSALPEPVTVQCIHTDGRHYQFFVFQLNTLDMDDKSRKNFWYTLPPLMLYEKAQYDDGRPVLEGYNPQVFRQIVAFYRNGS